ncbi:hypothetical protein SAMN04487970_105115 [Paenibacillus tianmuensis]|uniref:Uncharacterized protein n=1 Tax=Paenibacillus tianmuensis TaxID=624147 RepID=A0A1G4TFZ2_9BACL|nr:hypothetical protein [Paenibacillus tianmuensis]SCW80246.1 hypothetical protein SAMN04487970_105115 [Paenibacillus tianmuensis]
MFDKIINKKVVAASISELKDELILKLEDGTEINVQIVMPELGQFELEVYIE